MSNKFRQVRPSQIPPKPRQEDPQGDLGGHRGDKSGQLLPLTSGAVMEHVRIRKGELTKDVGWSQLGLPQGTLIGLFEHKWQFGGALFARVLRIFNEGIDTKSQYWDGTVWVDGPTASEPMRSVYLSMVSTQGCLFLADGHRIMRWCEDTLTQDEFHDFAAGLFLTDDLTGQRCSDEVIVSPALAVDSLYNVSFATFFDNIPIDQEVVVEVELVHNGNVFSRRLIRYNPGVGSFNPEVVPALDREIDPNFYTIGWIPWSNPDPKTFDPRRTDATAVVVGPGWTDDVVVVDSQTVIRTTVPVRRTILPGDTLQICVGGGTNVNASIGQLVIPLVDRSVLLPRTGTFALPIWQRVGAMTSSIGLNNVLDYVFRFGYRVPENTTLQLGFFIGVIGASGALDILLQDFQLYPAGPGGLEVADHTETYSVPDVPPGAIFALYVDYLSTGTGLNIVTMPFAQGPIMGQPQVEIDVGGVLNWSLHPYNFAYGDPKHGIEYRTITGSAAVFEPLSDDAPAARYIFPFGDRLIALQDFGDRQSLAWSADGNVGEWLAPDSGQIYLLDAQIDPVDDLMAGAAIGGGSFALYRKRSIWRGFETGNVAQAVGVVPWINGIGTEFRFSVQIVPGGNLFLGNDSMVYMLSEGGQLTPLGGPIIDEIRKRLTAENIRVDYDLVDSLFDSWLQEYWLAIPEDGATVCTAIWILDLGLYFREQKIDWRKRPMPQGVRRMAAVTMLPEPTGLS